MNAAVDLAGVLSTFQEAWSPRTVAVLNDYDVRVVKTQGAFTRHSHPDTDEFFLVLRGSLTIKMDARRSAGRRQPRRSTTTYSHFDKPVLRRPVESSQYTSIRYSGRLSDAGAVASIGSVGDSYDNAQAESLIGLYKTELVRHEGPWRGVDDLELATLGWVHWFNHTRLHGSIGHVPPIEHETAHYAALPTALATT